MTLVERLEVREGAQVAVEGDLLVFLGDAHSAAGTFAVPAGSALG